MSFTIRKADLSNQDELRAIAEIDVTIPALFDSDFETGERAVTEDMKRLKETFTKDDFFEVAIDEGARIIGIHAVRKAPYLNTGRFAGSVYTLWVDPAYRRSGLATQLKQRAEEWARQAELDHIWTWVHAKNANMLELNEKLGFEVTHFKMKKKL